MDKLILKAPAKLNLTLEIIRKREDGYHNLRSVFYRCEKLYDEIEIEFDPQGSGIRVESVNNGIPLNEKNICYKVAEAFFAESGKSAGLKIKINKKIPVGAGLGGGSSNGSTVLKALNEYFEGFLTDSQLQKIALSVGADLPFFLLKKNTALIEGVGEEIVENFDFTFESNFLIINPNAYFSTKKAFEELSSKLWFMDDENRIDISRKMVEAIKNKNLCQFSDLIYNDFSIVAKEKFPIINELGNFLRSFGAVAVGMTGKGPTVFGLFEKKEEMLHAKKTLAEKYPEFFIVEG